MKKQLLLICLFTIYGLVALAQPRSADELLKDLNQTTSANASEKVHLHLDKPYYAVGEDIWFKAYVVNAKTGAPSTISNVLYVELINEKEDLLRQLKLPMISGIAWADFKLSDTLTEGNYRIRAYTQWMRNGKEEFFFDKTIKIGNAWINHIFVNAYHQVTIDGGQRKTSTTIQFTDREGKPFNGNEINYQITLNKKMGLTGKKTTNNDGKITLDVNYKQQAIDNNSYILAKLTMANKELIEKRIPLIGITGDLDVQFLPEGGTLVENLPTKIGLKSVSNSGLGEPVSGKIFDKNGTELAMFETNKLGFGSFILNPLAGQTYTAKITTKNKVTFEFKLPEAEKTGAVLAVNNLESTVMGVKVYLSNSMLNTGNYHLVAQKNGLVYFIKKIASDRQTISLTVPKNNFPSGVLTLTLFSPELIPINERAVFVNGLHDKIEIDAENLKSSYEARQKVDLTFWATSKQEAVQGSFSVAVTNTTSVKPDLENESNIFTQLLLRSDIKGYVEKPNYYFLNNDKQTLADLDLLLLTQAWRRIDWKKLMAEKQVENRFAPEKSLIISGTVAKGGKPVVNGKITLASLKGMVFAAETVTDKNGRFVFDNIKLNDTLRYVVQARTEKDRKFVKIVLDEVPTLSITPNPNTGDIEVNVNQALSNYLKDSNEYLDNQVKKGLLNKTIQLNEVNVVKKRPTSKQWEELSLPGIIDKVINAKELEKVSTGLSRYLSNAVGRIYKDKDGGVYTLVHSKPIGMVVFIDGFNYTGALDDLDIDVIQSIEILTQSQGYAAGVSPGQGVIVISTKYGMGLSAGRSSYIPGLIKGQLIGYDTARTFYSPKYDVNPSTDPDLRTTVLWEPQVISGPDGKLTLSYFNTDVPGTYRMVIEGIDGSGNLGRKVVTYEVP